MMGKLKEKEMYPMFASICIAIFIIVVIASHYTLFGMDYVIIIEDIIWCLPYVGLTVFLFKKKKSYGLLVSAVVQMLLEIVGMITLFTISRLLNTLVYISLVILLMVNVIPSMRKYAEITKVLCFVPTVLNAMYFIFLWNTWGISGISVLECVLLCGGFLFIGMWFRETGSTQSVREKRNLFVGKQSPNALKCFINSYKLLTSANQVWLIIMFGGWPLTIFAIGKLISGSEDYGYICACLVVGLIGIVGQLLYTSYLIREGRKQYSERFRIQHEDEEFQIRASKYTGQDKYYAMIQYVQQHHHEYIKSLRKFGESIANSTIQEKEHDWAINGGIASGIAGPFVGAAVAIDTMEKNAKIREKNEINRLRGLEQKKIYDDMADMMEKNYPTSKSVSQMKYVAKFDRPVDELFSYLELSNFRTEIDEYTGAVLIRVDWIQKEGHSIDGALRANLYINGRYVCCGYLILPIQGTGGQFSRWKGTLDAICTNPEIHGKYDVKVEPINLWECEC